MLLALSMNGKLRPGTPNAPLSESAARVRRGAHRARPVCPGAAPSAASHPVQQAVSGGRVRDEAIGLIRCERIALRHRPHDLEPSGRPSVAAHDAQRDEQVCLIERQCVDKVDEGEDLIHQRQIGAGRRLQNGDHRDRLFAHQFRQIGDHRDRRAHGVDDRLQRRGDVFHLPDDGPHEIADPLAGVQVEVVEDDLTRAARRRG